MLCLYLNWSWRRKGGDNLASGSQKDVNKIGFFQDQEVGLLDYIQAVYCEWCNVVHSENGDEFIV